jgi:hypothetical protein
MNPRRITSNQEIHDEKTLEILVQIPLMLFIIIVNFQMNKALIQINITHLFTSVLKYFVQSKLYLKRTVSNKKTQNKMISPSFVVFFFLLRFALPGEHLFVTIAFFTVFSFFEFKQNEYEYIYVSFLLYICR